MPETSCAAIDLAFSAVPKYEPRSFNQSDLYQIKSDIGLPFLVHYLLNVPTCPYTPMEIIENCPNDSKRDVFNYVGYILILFSYF
jgi:hypothetical protein